MESTIDDNSTPNPGGQREGDSPSGESAHVFKRVRACTACRNMKIKCVSVPGSRDCEACLRFSRPCQDPGPPKARARPSQRFSELEKKIGALTNALYSERLRNQQLFIQRAGDPQWSRTPDSDSRDTDGSSPTRPGRDSVPGLGHGGIDIAASGDVFSQGLVDMPTAVLLFNHWNIFMRPFMPIIQFSPEEDVSVLRAEKPILLLVIMMIASTSIRPHLVPHFLARLNDTLAQEVFIQGARSLDLLQSMVLFSQYYIQPQHIKTFALPHHIYSAVVMAHDLGLDEVPAPNETDNRNKANDYRTLLAVYLGASSTATLLRRHQPIQPTSSYRASVDALRRHSTRDKDDEWLCSLVGLQEIFDEVSKTLNASSHLTDQSFDDFRTQHLLSIFRQRLADWKQSSSTDINPHLTAYAASIAELYIHQVAIRVYNRRMFPPPQDKDRESSGRPRQPFTATHTDALCLCLKASATALDIYLSLDDATTRYLPNIFLTWGMCAAVCLTKLSHFAANLSLPATAGNDRDNPPSPASYLDALIQRVANLSQNGYFPQSRPFLTAFQKLKIWYLQKRTVCINNSRGDCAGGSPGPVHDIVGTRTPPASPPATHAHVTSTPSSAQPDSRASSDNQMKPRHGSGFPRAAPEVPQIGQQNLDWGLSSYSLDRVDMENGTAIDTTTSDPGYDPDYLLSNMDEMELNLSGMKDLDALMMQTDDGELWSLLQ
ncbi:hypothetical protein GGS23DRAFT_603522 [Durotheca rogersii]|uniref:uncharacterized protein n=1 Tax=Durotheca rogersii TaxID=419775 RepID=UPI00221E745E|nr:uncharacterized protein GGS23DRAFT_603522 [Durotheca rogersii]KAI5866146.1 hypothetical protein GGS23DRAFT_603522 [Durotheca rogersii]